MAAAGPNLDAGPLRLSSIREEARKHLVDALDQRRGKKVLVLDPRVSGWLGLVAEVALLKEHGVEQLFHLSPSDPLPIAALETARSVVYLVRNRAEIVQQVARQVKAAIRREGSSGGGGNDFSLLLLPRKSLVAERVLQEEGVYGDVSISELPLLMVPCDDDVLSLEAEGALQEVLLSGDRSSLFVMARALMEIQRSAGTFPCIAGKGPAAAAVKDMLLRLRAEMGACGPPVGDAGVDACIIIDRGVDMVTPMATQLTYEGLVDELVGISNGFVSLDLQGQRQKLALNSSDRVFRELRDKPFGAVGPWLAERAKGLQTEYQDARRDDRSLAQLKEFAAQLRSLPQISRHVALAEHVTKRTGDPGFRARVRTEQELIDGASADTACETVQQLLYEGAPLATLLRLLCLVTLTHGGVPRRQYDPLRREILLQHGHEHMLTFSALHNAGLLRVAAGGRHPFPAVKRGLRLLVPDIDDRDPSDLAYTYAGYAPITARLVEGLLQGGWGGAIEDTLRQLPGPHFVMQQLVDDDGRPAAHKVASGRLPKAPDGERQVVLVAFVGGATLAEMSALRWLSQRPGFLYDFVFLTSQVINGNSVMDGFVDDTVRASAQRAAMAS